MRAERHEAKCSVCSKKHYRKGYCRSHYRRLLKYGDPCFAKPKISESTCTIEDCKEPQRARGYCSKHYRRLLAHGDPEKTLLTPPGEKAKWLISIVESESKDSCIIYPYGLNEGGYGWLTHEGKNWMAHRFVLAKKTGINPNDLYACHGECHNRACVNPSHLYWGTPSDNARDKIRDGTRQCGENNHFSKLTKADVIAIRDDSRLESVISEEYFVSQSTINRIRNRKTWVDRDRHANG